MDQILRSHPTLIISAIAGMGGLGKTELAVQYATRHLTDYPGGICWLNGQAGDLTAQLLTIATLDLGLTVPQEVPGRRTTTAEQVAWCWRNWVPAGSVLVVLDDLATWAQAEPIVPEEQRFRVLVTTRSQDLARQFPSISLDVLGLDQAVDLLGRLERRGRVGADRAAAETLCELVGRLPLGIELVGRYLAGDIWLSLTDMVTRLQAQGLQDSAYERPENAAMTAQRGIRAAFALTWERLEAPVQRVARLLGYFALDAIPWAEVEMMMRSVEGEDYTIRSAQRDLDHASLVEVQPEALEVCRLHPLIQLFLRQQEAAAIETTADRSLYTAFTARMIAIAAQIPDTPTKADIQAVEGMRSHLEALAQHWTEDLTGDDLLWAFLGIARFYKGQGLYPQAAVWYEQCRTTTAARLAADHPDVATSLNDLATLYRSQGRYGEAEPLYQRSLAIREQQLGADHPDVATSLNNLAALYRLQGRYGEAEPLYRRSLAIYEQQLGADHPDVATSLNNLALLYYAQGRYGEAEPLYGRSLAIREQQLGAAHPAVATSLNNLALLYYAQGRYGEAEPLLQRSLAIYEQQLGADHPDVATSLNSLALLYKSQGRYGEAEPLYVRSLEIDKKVYGEDHPEIATDLNNLAGLYYAQGRYGEAESLYVRSLAIREQQLGAEHPHVATSLTNLGAFYYEQGRLTEAEPLLVRALALREQILGAEHPHTIGTRDWLAIVRQAMQGGAPPRRRASFWTQLWRQLRGWWRQLWRG